MTRINIGANVKTLTDEHLLTEHREIKRLPSVYKDRINKIGNIGTIPKNFILGKGHVLFFIDKPDLTKSRYIEIYNECINRGFNVQNYIDNWDCYENKKTSDYTINESDKKIIQERITERLTKSNKKEWHYYRKVISKEKAINILYNNYESYLHR
ncbi:MAG: pyrimidine dimer DNA glycosylase/endonuclease V [Candidatus Muirbacterium halophilum]|nr:pyrimidine dimer DNA glycosylase/endonuclease V [Candidatus Muirbacterium halophilum]